MNVKLFLSDKIGEIEKRIADLEEIKNVKTQTTSGLSFKTIKNYCKLIKSLKMK